MWSGQQAGALRNKITLLPHRSPSGTPRWDLGGLPAILCRLGDLEVRLATSKKEIRRAQRLRYRVFFEQGSAVPDRTASLIRRDICRFDRVCDHLLVIDHAASGTRFGMRKPKIAGTYRLLRQEIAERNFGFYSAQEYDIGPLLARQAGKRFLELGRSCVLPEYRNKRTVELLWQGIWAYVRYHGIDVMFGCASLEGTEPAELAVPLSFLHHHAGAPDDWHARALDSRYVAMDRLPQEAVDARKALAALPPLVKGYLRLGATFGEGAVVDHQFGTTDVLVILPVAAIEQRYTTYFGQTAERRAA